MIVNVSNIISFNTDDIVYLCAADDQNKTKIVFKNGIELIVNVELSHIQLAIEKTTIN